MVSRMKCKERLNDVEFICVKAMSDSSDCSLPFEISVKKQFSAEGAGGGRGVLEDSTLLLGHMRISVVFWGTHSNLDHTLGESQPSWDCFHFQRRSFPLLRQRGEIWNHQILLPLAPIYVFTLAYSPFFCSCLHSNQLITYQGCPILGAQVVRTYIHLFCMALQYIIIFKVQEPCTQPYTVPIVF